MFYSEIPQLLSRYVDIVSGCYQEFKVTEVGTLTDPCHNLAENGISH